MSHLGGRPRAWCVCGELAAIEEARETTLAGGYPGWEGRCEHCGRPLVALRRSAR